MVFFKTAKSDLQKTSCVWETLVNPSSKAHMQSGDVGRFIAHSLVESEYIHTRSAFIETHSIEAPKILSADVVAKHPGPVRTRPLVLRVYNSINATTRLRPCIVVTLR